MMSIQQSIFYCSIACVNLLLLQFRYNKSTKLGRGFTLQEVKAAGLSVAVAKSVGVRVDHRRKNRSQESLELNKQRLLAYVSKLAVFPR